MDKAICDVGIWGQFGDGGKIADGQAVRTTIITNELINRYGVDKVRIVNTNNWSRHPVAFFISCLELSREARKIVIFPADNGFRVIVPILTMMNIFYRRELYYVVIGGFLPKLLENKKYYIRLLQNFRALFVQTQNIKDDLEALGIKNISILSNLKRIEARKDTELLINDNTNVTVCTFSRVTESKGIENAIDAVRLANEKLGFVAITVDVYGVIDRNYQDTFTDLLRKNAGIVRYRGVADYDKTVHVLKDYFCLVFPTYYYGEGFPGNIIDAFYTGLPIIATDWLYNRDFIQDQVNGLLVPIKAPREICKALLTLYNDRKFANKIAINNLKEVEKYHPEKVLRVLYEYLDS